ncbi:hypothetical protein M1M86_00980 [Dehalococcoidales bacterium]|nr:hypothetical protein [Dehalococcoidales bacterium]
MSQVVTIPLGKCSQHCQHEFPRRRREVYLLRKGNEGNITLSKFLKVTKCYNKVSRKAIQLVDNDHINLARERVVN